MFKENYPIYQRHTGDIPGQCTPESQKPPVCTERMKALLGETACMARKEMMEKNPVKIVDQILEDVFGHNKDIVSMRLGPKYDKIVQNLSGYKAGEGYVKSVLGEDGNVYAIFILEGQYYDMNLKDVLSMTHEEISVLWPLITLKREKRAPETKAETPELRADKYIRGPIMDVIKAYIPDSIPDDFNIIGAIMASATIKEIRAALIESYKRGKPYEITTTDEGFKLESHDPSLKTKEYNLEKFFDLIRQNPALSKSKVDKTTELDREWAGREAEEMTIDELELLLFGNESQGIRPRTIKEIEAIYGPIPDTDEEPVMDALIAKAQRQYFPDAYKMGEDVDKWLSGFKHSDMTFEDKEHLIQLAHKQLDGIVKECSEFGELDAIVNRYFENPDDEEARKTVKSEFFGKFLKLSHGTMKQAAAAKFYEYFLKIIVEE